MATKKSTAGESEIAGVENAEGIIYVNGEKLARAKNILTLVSGARTPRDQSEADLKERWTTHCADAEIQVKSAGALRFVYEKMGGLVRTPSEEEEHQGKVKEMQKKSKKRAIEADK